MLKARRKDEPCRGSERVEERIRQQSTFLAGSAAALAVLVVGRGPGTASSMSRRSALSSTSATGLIVRTPTAPSSSTRSATGRHPTVTVGLVVSRTRVANGYRIVLAPAKMRDAPWAVIPGRATQTYLIPQSFVPEGSMLSGPIRVTTNGQRVTALSIF